MSAPQQPILSHPLNLLLITSAAVAAAWTVDWRPLVVGAVAEVIWWIVGPVMNRRRSIAARRVRVDDAEQAQLRSLDEALRRRFLELDRVRADVRRLAGGNPALEAVGLERELEKVDALVDGWLRLAAGVVHMRAVIDETDLERLEAERDEAEGPARERLDLRLEAARAAQSRLAASEAELERVETELAGLRDRVLSLSSPSGLGEQVDELLGGVDAAERAVRELHALEEGGDRVSSDRARRQAARSSVAARE